MVIRTMRQVIAELSPVPIMEGCNLRTGQNVWFTNDYGVTFGPHKIIGFDKGDGILMKYGKHVYLDFDSYWCPVAEKSLSLIDPTAEIHPNADIPGWVPKNARRVYACDTCGAETEIATNHCGTVWATPCKGLCKDIYNPHTAREHVECHPPRRHNFVRDAG